MSHIKPLSNFIDDKHTALLAAEVRLTVDIAGHFAKSLFRIQAASVNICYFASISSDHRIQLCTVWYSTVHISNENCSVCVDSGRYIILKK